MDDPNITMVEYIRLQAEKARRRGQTFIWETATYGKLYCYNLDFFTDFEADFLAIIYNDALTSNENVSPKPTVNRVHILDFGGLTEEMRQALTDRLRMDHKISQVYDNATDADDC
ncbi:hypothetical protein Tco_0720065 [Tanacetum coccineum]